MTKHHTQEEMQTMADKLQSFTVRQLLWCNFDASIDTWRKDNP